MATWDFTEAERHSLDIIAAKIAAEETLTTDEALLYARFEAYKAVNDAEFQAEIERKKAESQAAIAQAESMAETARQSFEAMAAQAMERYERTLNNG